MKSAISTPALLAADQNSIVKAKTP